MNFMSVRIHVPEDWKTYHRRCVITGKKTLPVLEVWKSHI